MSMRQLRLEAAHRELGSRHPWATILGRPAAKFAGLVVLAAGLYFGARAVWHAVSGWATTVPGPSPAPVSHAVPGAVPWWGWVLLAGAVLALVVVVARWVPRIAFRLRWGIWPTY